MLTGAERDDRRARSTAPTSTCCAPRPRRSRTAMTRRAGRDEPEGRAAGARAADRRAPAARRRARSFGLTPGDVRRAATTLVTGTKVGEVYEDQKIFDVVGLGRAGACGAIVDALRQLPIETPPGGTSPLRRRGRRRDRARRPTRSSAKAASRRIDVTCNVQRPRPRARRPRDRGSGRGAAVRPRLPPRVPRRVRRPRRVAAAAAGARPCSRCSASCCCCTPTSARCG